MRDAIGHTFLYNIVIVFVFIIAFVLVGSLSYSKAFKAKNEIISIIEKHREYDAETIAEIDATLKDSGYRSRVVFRHNTCPAPKEGSSKVLLEESVSYPYCVYENVTERGVYYSVIIYMRFEVPLLSGLLEFPVKGDTRTIYDLDV
ncbi:MAG: hypothetical protein HFH08_01565 [Bacilli bacterium]|nr:hypothetical protein [Bacilli bacterium]